MKIINIYNGDFLNSSQGGGMRYLRDLMLTQKNKGYQIELLAVGEGSARYIEIEGVMVRYIPISRTLKWPFFLWGLICHLLRSGRDYNNQIIHLHRIYFSPPFRLLVRNAHIVTTIHSKTFAVITERIPFLYKMLPLLLFLEKVLIKTCVNRLSAAGDYAIDLYEERHDLDRDTVVPLRCPSLIVPVDQAAKELSDDTRKNILCVGRIAAVKRPINVLELFENALKKRPKLIDKYRLIFIGEGDERAVLESAVSRLGLDPHVKLIGSVQADFMPHFYAAGSCLVLLSSSEVAPFTVKEALTCGLPVFSTDVGIVSEYIPVNCGTIIPVEYPESNSEMFLEFLDRKFDQDECKAHAKYILQKEIDQFDKGLNRLYLPLGSS